MGKLIKVEGFDACFEKIEELKGKTTLFIMFSGSKDEKTGISWCPDCVTAEPVIEKCFKDTGDDVTLLYVAVGQRDFWKKQDNPFRTHEKLRLKGVPTLMKWGGPQKLVEEELFNEDLVQMLFEDE